MADRNIQNGTGYSKYGEINPDLEQDGTLELVDINKIPEISLTGILGGLRREITDRYKFSEVEKDSDIYSQITALSTYFQEKFKAEDFKTLKVRSAFSGAELAAAKALEQMGILRGNIVHQDFDTDVIQILNDKGYSAEYHDSAEPTGEQIDILHIMNPYIDSSTSYEDWLKNVSADVSENGIIVGNVPGFEDVGFHLVGRTFYDAESKKAVFQSIDDEGTGYRSTDRDHMMFVYERNSQKSPEQ